MVIGSKVMFGNNDIVLAAQIREGGRDCDIARQRWRTVLEEQGRTDLTNVVNALWPSWRKTGYTGESIHMRILLAVDSSAASDAAIREIAGRRWPSGSAVEILTVTEPVHLWTPVPRLDEEIARRAGGLASSRSPRNCAGQDSRLHLWCCPATRKR